MKEIGRKLLECQAAPWASIIPWVGLRAPEAGFQLPGNKKKQDGMVQRLWVLKDPGYQVALGISTLDTPAINLSGFVVYPLALLYCVKADQDN